MTKHKEDFKREVVQAYLAGHKGYRALGAQYEVGRATIQRWVKRYRQHGDDGLRMKYSHYSADSTIKLRCSRWPIGMRA